MKLKELTKIHKALSNENRLEIFMKILQEQNLCPQKTRYCLVTDIVEQLSIGAPTISHHLKELVNAGLIETRKEGKFLVAAVNEEVWNEFVKQQIQCTGTL